MASLTCPVCDKKYIYPYVHFNDSEYPKTCGDKLCVQNLKYQQAHRDIQTGEVQDPKDIRKW